MNQQIIDQIKGYGFDVYMRDPKDTWLLFTDGENIGYLQQARGEGISIRTVHAPNTTSGTGFQIERHVGGFDRDMLVRAFAHAPQWVDRPARQSVRKYKGIEDYRAANPWNGGYKKQ